MNRADRLRGRVRLRVSDSEGSLVAERRSENVVVKRGAEIVAGLLSGAASAARINRLQLGFGRESVGVEATSLTPPADDAIPAAALQGVIPPESFTVQTDRPDVLQLLITTDFSPSVELSDVSEAGLMAGDALYNQVVFEPITLRVGQDITFFWEVDLPYGR